MVFLRLVKRCSGTYLQTEVKVIGSARRHMDRMTSC